MSIHELHFDEKGNIKSQRCIDADILAATDMPERNDKLPSIGESNPVPSHRQIHDEHKGPKIVRTLTAISKNQVREEEFVLGFGIGGCGYTKMPMSSNVYPGEEINHADLRIGNVGYAYSKTDVYVAPKRDRLPVISKIVHPNS